MNKLLSSIALSSLLITGNAQANEACETVLCIGGSLLGGKGGSACKKAIKNYFDIKRYKKSKFNGSRTCDARQDYLNGCSEARSSDINRIQNKYCSVMNSPGF